MRAWFRPGAKILSDPQQSQIPKTLRKSSRIRANDHPPRSRNSRDRGEVGRRRPKAGWQRSANRRKITISAGARSIPKADNSLPFYSEPVDEEFLLLDQRV
jgi:hypothetical protein